VFEIKAKNSSHLKFDSYGRELVQISGFASQQLKMLIEVIRGNILISRETAVGILTRHGTSCK